VQKANLKRWEHAFIRYVRVLQVEVDEFSLHVIKDVTRPADKNTEKAQTIIDEIGSYRAKTGACAPCATNQKVDKKVEAQGQGAQRKHDKRQYRVADHISQVLLEERAKKVKKQKADEKRGYCG
jgi:hypothetical protein